MGTLSGYVLPLVNILKVALGLGFVIFIHELGHFLLAKWNGVKVEKFSIGFGPTLFGFRSGETEYVLAAVPLGGFVKMLGESPEDEEQRTTDPRAYHNKPVGARMAIISAGVIMNILFGIVCYSFLFTQPRIELSSQVGAVSPGSPAYEAGIMPGDEILAIDGQTEIGFGDLMRKVVLSGHDQVLNFVVKRAGAPEPLSFPITPRREAAQDRPVIGVQPASDLRLQEFLPPAGMDKPPTYPRPGEKASGETSDFVRAAAVADGLAQPVASIGELQDLMARNGDKELTLQIERKRGDSSAETFDFRLPPNHFVDLGLRLNIAPILAVRKGSAGEKAGFQAGDLIVEVDGAADFDPMRLPYECQAKQGKPMRFVIERKDGASASQRTTLSATPDATPPWVDPTSPNQALDVPGLGICYQVVPRVRSVVAESPAAAAGIKPGDVVNTLAIVPDADPANGGKPDGGAHEFKLDSEPVWVRAFVSMQFQRSKAVKLTVNNAPKVVEIKPAADPDWFNPARGLFFSYLTKTVPPREFAAAVKAGVGRTYGDVLDIYTMLRGLFVQRIGPSNLGGPITIAQTAYAAAGHGWADLIGFLGLMSINLAVLNFLPIPPLDGGQMTFLLFEKIRGRPLPESILIGAIYIGLPLVLLVMVFATYQDVFRLIKDILP